LFHHVEILSRPVAECGEKKKKEERDRNICMSGRRTPALCMVFQMRGATSVAKYLPLV
jgi:hypothetical protein